MSRLETTDSLTKLFEILISLRFICDGRVSVSAKRALGQERVRYLLYKTMTQKGTR